jgi:hypothetical protein
MPNNSEISFLRAAVGLLSAAKKRSRCVSCSGVTRDRFRFSRDAPVFDLGALEELPEERVRDDVCSKRDCCPSSSAVGDSGGGGASVEADNGTSPGVLGDMDALGEDAVDSVTSGVSSAESYLRFGPRLR